MGWPCQRNGGQMNTQKGPYWGEYGCQNTKRPSKENMGRCRRCGCKRNVEVQDRGVQGSTSGCSVIGVGEGGTEVSVKIFPNHVTGIHSRQHCNSTVLPY